MVGNKPRSESMLTSIAISGVYHFCGGRIEHVNCALIYRPPGSSQEPSYSNAVLCLLGKKAFHLVDCKRIADTIGDPVNFVVLKDDELEPEELTELVGKRLRVKNLSRALLHVRQLVPGSDDGNYPLLLATAVRGGHINCGHVCEVVAD